MSNITFLKKITWPGKIFLGILILLVISEAFFDVFEIAIGWMMLKTNEYRPKVGRLWKAEEKDQAGQSHVTTLIDSLSQIPTYFRKIKNLDDLHSYLVFKSFLLLSTEEFITLYRSFPSNEATRLLDSVLLYDLMQDSNWRSIRLSSSDDKISLLFLDPYGQPILDAYAFVGDITDGTGQGQLQNDLDFAVRIIPGRLFLVAYDGLDKNMQMQIINDPRLITRWRERLVQVGIAAKVQNGSVAIAIETLSGGGTEIAKLEASEIAINYLIQAINDLLPSDKLISLPEKEEVQNE